MTQKNLNKLLIFLLLILFTSLPTQSYGEKTKEIKIKDKIEKKLPLLIELGSHKCIPCQKMTPILAELEKEYKRKFNIEFIDLLKPENKKKGIKYKIKTIPTQIFLNENKKELDRHVGFISKKDILKKWKELGFNFKMNSKKEVPFPNGCCGID